MQGQTIPNPTAVVVDFRGSKDSSMIYVMLSRAQTLDQIYIIDSLHESLGGWRPDPTALEEWETSKSRAINTAEGTDVDEFKLLCLNIFRLKKHFEDIARTVQATSSLSVICLQETWLGDGDNVDMFQLPNMKLNVNSKGSGRGLATYYDDQFEVTDSVGAASCQITKITSHKTEVINVYRSKDCCMKDFISMIFKLIDNTDKSKHLILCGDVNIKYTEETTNIFVRKMIDEYNFKQLVTKPSQDRGNIIDHVYVSPGLQGRVEVDKTCLYYSDHDLLTIKVKESSNNEMSLSD